MIIKYSIIIPTRNRAEYLPYAIKSVLNTNRKDIELIVSDNHSTDDTQDKLQYIKDNRLKVIKPPITLPMAAHYEYVLKHARGSWITIIGDDDAIMPYFYERLDHYIEKYSEIEIISSSRAYYFWKGSEHLYGGCVINYLSSNKCKIRSTKQDLKAVLQGRRSCFDMPQIYTTCIIKRSLYEEIKNKSNGIFYHSIIPDMYSVVAICLSRDNYLRIDEPLFWVGTSSKSLGISDRIYKDASKFVQHKNEGYDWVTTHISDLISYEIHSGAFSPIYIFECLLKTPLKNKMGTIKQSREWVYAAVLSQLSFKRHSNKRKVIHKICKEIFLYKLNKTKLCVHLVFNCVFLFITALYTLSAKVAKSCKLNADYIYLRSSNRHKYDNIAKASIGIEHERKQY